MAAYANVVRGAIAERTGQSEAALEDFPGTVLLVSHDRALLDAVAHRTAAVEDGTVRVYEGGWADYLRAREEREAPPPEPKPKPKPKKEPKAGLQKAPRSPQPLELLEREIEEQEALIARIEGKLAEDWADADAVAQHRAAREELQSLLARWERMLDEVAG